MTGKANLSDSNWAELVFECEACLTEAADGWAPGEALTTGLLFTFLGLRKKWASR